MKTSKPKLKYKIYRCYEVAVYDKDDNQIGESEFIYTDRKSAKERAEAMLKEAENNASDETGSNENFAYQSGMTTVKILNKEEAEHYRNMPNGVSQDANAFRSVAEKDGKKQILEITANGISRINVNV